MARPQKTGIDYFPLDVDMDYDDKVQLIEAEHGITGFGIIIKLLMKIYAEGYYYQWTEKEQLLFSKRVNVDINQVNAVINSCLKWGLFDGEVYEKHKILTSSGIQKRYVTATSRRKGVQMIQEYMLIDIANAPNIVIVDINGVNVDINSSQDKLMSVKTPQSKVKESKVDNTLSTPSQGVDSPSPAVAPDTETPKEAPKATNTPYQDIVDLYLEICPSLPRMRVLTEKRRQQIRARWKKYPDIEIFREVFSKAELSDFLSGRSGKWTSCNFDWLLNENNMVKVLEGNYDNRDPTPKRSPPSHLTVANIRKQRGGGAGADKPTAQGP